MEIQAKAAASYNRVALDRMLIDQLPQIVREAAGGLANANINVLNGAGGLADLAAGLVGQGPTIFDSVKRNLTGLGESTGEERQDGSGPSPNGAAQLPATAPVDEQK